MTFDDKSTMTTTLLLVVEYSVYSAVVFGSVAGSPDREVALAELVVGATVVFAVLAAVSHVVLALVFRGQARTPEDERHRVLSLRSQRWGNHVLAVGVFTGIVLAVLQVEAFWIAQALIAAWVLSEISAGVVKLVLLRPGVREQRSPVPAPLP